MSLLKHEIKYTSNSATLFAKVAHHPWATFLDSGRPQSQYGRYDIIVADPFVTVVTEGNQTLVNSTSNTLLNDEDPFTVLKQLLEEYQVPANDIPFCGGAVGYFAYDLSRRLEHLPEISANSENVPQMMVGIYDWALVVDHKLQSAYLVSHAKHPQTKDDWEKLCQLFDDESTQNQSEPEFRLLSEINSNMNFARYTDAFERIKRYISEGDCYQVNLAQRFSARAHGDAWSAYLHLRQISPAPFMAYMSLPNIQVLSASPERFLQVKDLHVETRPIKGTRPRSSNAIEDVSNANELTSSLKDRAENLMIVDLLRNDISKTCAIGSVRADRLFSLESFANVHHLVSTVTGKLATGMTSIDLLRGCFPGGSITGAPKLRSMQIIEELEPNRRGLYCGAIGYIGFDGNMDTNISIRTAVYSEGEIRFWAGGGIVADSQVEKEYKETWDKASSMLDLMLYFKSR